MVLWPTQSELCGLMIVHFKYLMPHMVADNLLLVDFQVFEVAPSLHMVELRKIGGDTLEFHNVCQHSNFYFYMSETKKKKNEK